jgi:CRISPR-associated protein Cas2
MQTLVVYDIPNDRARTKIADACLDYGLDRIQYSAFLGDLQRTHQEELLKKIAKQLGKKAGKVHLFAICEKDWRLRLEIVQEGQEPSDTEPAGPGASQTDATEAKSDGTGNDGTVDVHSDGSEAVRVLSQDRVLHVLPAADPPDDIQDGSGRAGA